MYDDGSHGDRLAADDIYTFQYSLDQNRLEGLLLASTTVQFLIVIDSIEYKGVGSVGATSGITVDDL